MSPITSAARKIFDHLFSAAVRANIGQQATDDIAVAPAAAPTGKGEQPRTLVLLTCASLRSKLVAVFQVVNEPLARADFGSNKRWQANPPAVCWYSTTSACMPRHSSRSVTTATWCWSRWCANG